MEWDDWRTLGRGNILWLLKKLSPNFFFIHEYVHKNEFV